MTMLMSALAYWEEGARHEASARRCESESTPREAWRRHLAGATNTTPHRGRDRAGWVWRISALPPCQPWVQVSATWPSPAVALKLAGAYGSTAGGGASFQASATHNVWLESHSARSPTTQS